MTEPVRLGDTNPFVVIMGGSVEQASSNVAIFDLDEIWALASDYAYTRETVEEYHHQAAYAGATVAVESISLLLTEGDRQGYWLAG